jgi:hypothetical protein
LNYEFSQVEIADIEGWLDWIGIELPVEASGSLWAQRSSSGWFDWKNYRLEGEVTSPQLQIDQWRIEQARLRIGYANRHWYVGRLSGSFVDPEHGATIGSASISAEVPITEMPQVRMAADIHSVDLAELLRTVGIEGVSIRNNDGQLNLLAEFPLRSVNEVSSWDVTGELLVSGVTWNDLTPGSVTATGELHDGKWRIGTATVNWLPQPLTFTGLGSLDGSYPFELSMAANQLSLSSALSALDVASTAPLLSGLVDLRADVHGNLQLGVDTINASLRSERISVETVPLSNIDVSAKYGSSGLAVDVHEIGFSGGSLSGTSRWSSLDNLVALIPDSSQFAIESIELAQLPEILFPIPATGLLSGELTFSSKPSQPPDNDIQIEDKRDSGRLWSATGHMTGQDVQIMETPIGNVRLTLDKDISTNRLNSRLTIGDTVEATLGVRLLSSNNVALQHTVVDEYDLVGHIRNYSTQVRLPAATPIIPLELTGRFELQGTPAAWLTRGSAHLESLALSLVSQPILLQDAIVDITPSEFRLREFRVSNQTALVAGSGIFRREESGEHQINLQVSKLQLGNYAELLPPGELRAVGGQFDLLARLRKRASASNWSDGWTGQLNSSLNNLEYRKISLGQLMLRGDLSEDTLTALLDGGLFGGKVEVNLQATTHLLKKSLAPLGGQSNVQSAEESPSESGTFQAELLGVDVARLLAVVLDRRQAASLAGSATLKLQGGYTPPTGWQIESQLQVPDLLHNRTPLARGVNLQLELSNGILNIREFSGRIAGGRIESRGAIAIPAFSNSGSSNDESGSGNILFDAQRLRLDGLIELLYPEYAGQFGGTLSYRGRAVFNRNLLFNGDLHATDAIAFGLPIQRAHGGLRIGLNEDGSLRELSSSNLTGIAVGGGFASKVNLRGGTRMELDSTLRIANGKLDQLSRALGFERIIGTGRFDASAALSSRRATSLADLNGDLQLDFESGDTQSVPILPELARFAPSLQLASTDITDGVLHARIGQGRLFIRDLFLNSNAFWLAGQGSVGLIGGRLDIEAFLQTGGGLEQQLSQTVVQRLALGIIPQATLLTAINDLVRNRTLYFHIGGTPDHPVVQPRAARTLGKALLQNIARQLLAVPVTAAATANE